MWRPANGVYKRGVAAECDDRVLGHADVEDDYFVGLVHDGCEVVGVVAVPGDSEEGQFLRLEDDGGVFEFSEVEVADGAVLACGGEGVHVVREGDVVHRLVVRDQLRFDALLVHVPDRAGRVDRGGADHARVV